MRVVAYDFDGSILLQQPLLQKQGLRLSVQSMRHFERSIRLWSSAKNFQKMASELRDPGNEMRFCLLGSGDYHHVSLALIAQHTQPLTVVLFDNHPDWMRPPHQFHCGTWVYGLARLPQVQRILIIGLESGDIDADRFRQGDIESYQQGKIVLLPYRQVWLDAPVQGYLSSLLAQNLTAGICEILSHMTTEHVYVSIDKDCLREADAKTNWEQGTMPLSTVISVIRSISEHKTIVGADSVGDFSPIRFWSPLKWMASWLDRRIHPREQLEEASSINARANAALIEAFSHGVQ